MTADTHLLTGAYVCDALSDSERAAFEEHLAQCPACAREIAELRATAARLGTAAAVEPPEALRQRVMARVAATRQLPPLVGSLESARERRRQRWTRRTSWGVAAGLLAGFAALGGVAVHQRHEIDAMRQAHGTMARFLAADDLHTAVGRATMGGTVAIASSRSRDAMLVTVSGLPALPSTKTYELWMKKSGVMYPGPLVRPTAHGGTSQLMTHGVDGASLVAMTVEPAQGSRHPTSAPVLTVALG